MKKATLLLLLCCTLLAGCGGTCRHKNTEIMEAKAPNCLEDGSTGALVCHDCKQILTPSSLIPALGHDKVLIGWVEATCTTPGNSGSQVCTRCGTVFSQAAEIPALGHVEELVNEKAATYDSDGYSGDTVCKYCGTLLTSGNVLPQLTQAKTASPETKVTKEAAPVPKATETKAPETKVPAPTAVETTVPEVTVQEIVIVETTVPETTIPETTVPETTVPETTAPAPVSGSSAAQTLFQQMNASRTANGLSPLSWDNALVSACQIRAQEHADNYAAGMPRDAHSRPDGRAFGTVLADTGFRTDWQDCGENLALAVSVDLIHPAWMDSPSHRGAILDPSYTHAAIAVVNQNGYYFACCLFWC